jgi:hypothetical protein
MSQEVKIRGSDGTNEVNILVDSSGRLVTVAESTGADNGSLKISTSVATELTRTSDGSVTPLQFTVARAVGGTGRIIGSRLAVSSATAFGAIRLHLFNTTPFAAGSFQGDNAAMALTYAAFKTGSAGTNPNYIGFIDYTSFTAHTTSAVSVGVANQTELAFFCAAASQVIFGLLEARAAFTPASAETFNVALDIVQD